MLKVTFADILEARKKVEFEIISKSLSDSAFRAALLADPKKVYSQELGVALPPDTEVQVVQEDTQTIYLVLPLPVPELIEISETELDDTVLDGLTAGTVGRLSSKSSGIIWLGQRLLDNMAE